MLNLCKMLKKILTLKNVQIAKYSTELSYQVPPFQLHMLDINPSPTVKLTRDEALKYYDQMRTIREMESTTNQMYKQRKVRGFCHLYSGQEAVGVGIKAALKPNDSTITSYRSHAWCYLMSKQADVIPHIFAELLGKESGVSRGKGGSMHMYGDHFYGGNAIVGAQVPLGVGVAFAAMYKNVDETCVTIFGDGAANNGQVYESYNIAKLWNIPCLFLIENNLFGMGTATARATAQVHFFTKGEVIPGILCDGMDILAVREAARIAREHCSSRKGPMIVEALTYRYFGHSLSDPGTSYRSHKDVKEVRDHKDPIQKFKKLIVDGKLLKEEELSDIDKKVKKRIKAAQALAEKAPEPKIEELTCDIYASDVTKEVRGVNPLVPNWKHKILKGVPTFVKY